MSAEKDELNFEQKLYDYLANLGGTKQWQQRDDLKTTDDLWENFRKIVYNLNQDKLSKPLSDNEFSQVKRQIQNLTGNPYNAGKFLYGVGGKSQVEIDRDDNKHVYLTIFDQDEIGAGNTVYEVVRQIKRSNVLNGKKNRRFDTTLLINGLPLIQIEEKADGHSAKEAFNQMQQYAYEGQYSGIFSTLQILVAMTPHDVRYMANIDADHFNTDFAFQWKDDGKNKYPILNWREFADKFLSIPMAHKMATNFMILDNNPKHQSIKVMRYYQVYSTEKVINKLKNHDFAPNNQKIGYVWHTTGSGKTITSFKTAFLASRLSNVDKVVFLVDRRALTNQTAEEYKAYDPNADDNNQGGSVEYPTNTYDLKAKLCSKNKTSIIVTSTQKMHTLVKEHHFSIDNQNIVFIVDEAHRSTGGSNQSDTEGMVPSIKKAFKHSAWIGYTGTPNFDAKKGPTTKQIFGPCLHLYVISDAIADHNVLGFKVDFQNTLPQSTLKEQYLPRHFSYNHPDWSKEKIQKRIDSLKPEDMDDTLSSSVYDDQPDHVHAVVNDVLKYWNTRSINGKYNALFTTHVGGNKSSTPKAIQYYDEFKEQMKDPNNPNLNIAVTFSQDTSNDDSQLSTNRNLSKVMNDYNRQFNTHFDDTTVKEYQADVVNRLKRLNSDGKYLDLVIVINQLLTGFDAPQLNTLYVDRTLKGAQLIQAYSRTNRIYDMKTKQYGRIVNYRWPHNSEKLMNEALRTYSNPDSANENQPLNIPKGVIAESYDDVKKELRNNVQTLSNLTDHFKAAPKSEHKQEETYNQLKSYNGLINRAKSYDEFKDTGSKRLLNDIGLDEEKEAQLTGGIADTIRQDVSKQHNVEPIDLDFHMEHVSNETINYDYLHDLIADYANHSHDKDLPDEELKQKKNHIYQLLDSMGNNNKRNVAKLRNILNVDFANELKDFYPLSSNQVESFIKNHDDNWSLRQMEKFVKRWGLENADKLQKIQKLIDNHQINHDDLDQNGTLNDLTWEGRQNYKENANDENVRKLSKIKYNNRFRNAFKKLANKIKKYI